jgi:exodeoxyribonuclease V alpha subunit
MAKRIVEKFGNDTLAVMEYRADELARVRGISPQKAATIAKRYAEIKQMQAAVSFLCKFDISINIAIRVFNKYGDQTIDQVQKNPYKLIETIDGIGFLTADKIARDLGISYVGHFRIRAGIVHVLKTAAEADGHTCLPIDKLFALVMRLLLIKPENLRPVFDGVIVDLCLDKYLTRVGDNLALTKFYAAEKLVSEKIKFFASRKAEILYDIEKHIEQFEKVHKINLHPDQKAAVITSVSCGVTIITGGPGTGKTTIIRAILYLNEKLRQTAQLLAPTGRAAKRLEETCGIAASTIHRALDIDYKNGKGVFTYDDPENVLKANMVICDEVSMCDAILMSQLLKKVLLDTRVVLVGDIDQLASVGAGNVLADLISSQTVPVVRLTQIYRQDEKSKIITNAHAINHGEMPDITNKSTDFFFESAQSPAEIKQKVLSLVTSRLPKFLGTAQVQVLCPMKMGEAGMTSLNLALQSALNPPAQNKPEIKYADTIFRICDRVMQTQNNYSQEWQKGAQSGTGVYNGDTGTIVSIFDGEVRVKFEDDRESVYVKSDLLNLVPSYAITVHQSQGCEFPAVVVPVTSGAYMILTRNLLYTAVTRAKKFVMLVGSAENIQKMVENTYTKKRFTMLETLLKNQIETF